MGERSLNSNGICWTLLVLIGLGCCTQTTWGLSTPASSSGDSAVAPSQLQPHHGDTAALEPPVQAPSIHEPDLPKAPQPPHLQHLATSGSGGDSTIMHHHDPTLDAAAAALGASSGASSSSSKGHSAHQPGSGFKQQRKQQLQPGVHQPGTIYTRPRIPWQAVTLMSAALPLMSCLGVLPYFFCSRLSKPWAGVANAVASGVMLAASFGLLAEGAPYGGTYLILGMLLGVVFVKFSQEHLEQYEVDGFEQLAGADARKVILFLAVMAVHAVGEGGGVGVSFAGDRGWAQGTLVTLAIGLHNIPEGLAVATVMAAKGTPPRSILLWTCLTALPQALVAPPAYVFVDTFRALLPLAMGFAAGCMIWVVIAELLPDALEAVDAERVATCATGSAAWLQGLSIWIAHLETPAGTLASPFGDYQAVLPLGLAPLLPQLAPAALLPLLLAAGTASLAVPRSVLAAASAGLLGAYAGACWLQLLLGSPHRLLSGVLAPAVGAAVAAALWRQLRGWQQQRLRPRLSRAGSQESPTQASHAFDAAAAEAAMAVVAAAAAAANGGGGMIPAGVVMQQQQQSGSPGGSHSSESSSLGSGVDAHVLAPLPKLAMQQQHLQHLQQQQQQQHWSKGAAAASLPRGHNDITHVITSSGAHALGHMHARHARNSDPLHQQPAGDAALGPWEHQHHQQQQQLPGSSSSSLCSSIHSNGSPQRALLTTSPLLLPGRGELSLPVTAPGRGRLGPNCKGGAALFGQHSGYDSSVSWAFANVAPWGGGVLSSKNGGKPCSHSGQAVAAASMLALGGAAAAGVPLGLQLASALTADPSGSGHVVVPLLLIGSTTTMSCIGFLLLLLGQRRMIVATCAGLISVLPILAAVAALLSQPEWVQQGSARVAADSLQGLAAGYSTYVLLLLLLPMVRQWGSRAAGLSLWGGAAAGCLVCLALKALCASTPYCLHVNGAGVLG